MPLSMCGWKASADDVLNVTGLQVRPNLPALPKLFQDQQSSGGPLEKYQCTGIPFKSRPIRRSRDCIAPILDVELPSSEGG